MRTFDLAQISKKVRSFSRRFSALPLPGPGIYTYDRRQGMERSRIHLRIDKDGSGMILVNANRVLHLNPSAILMSWLCLEGVEKAQALRTIQENYAVATSQANADFERISHQITELIRPDGACPIHELELDVIPPFSAEPSAPYRMDLAITYRCNNDCAHCYNDRPRNYHEISTQEWFSILDQCWSVGIPHVVFTGGEPTLRDDLPDLIRHAERNGQITGINTNGRRLRDRGFLERLIEAGLDHVQITLESHDADIHDQMVQSRGAWKQTVAGIENVLNSPLYMMTNTTLLVENSPTLAQTLEFLAVKGVPVVGLNALIYSGRGADVGTGLPEAQLPPLLEQARAITEAHQQRLIWYTPTEYCHFDPQQLQLGVKGCTAARYNMCIEPDGAVLPCQSYYTPVGNILHDSWETIWNHELCLSLREHANLPEKCGNCALLPECGGGCPLKRNTE